MTVDKSRVSHVDMAQLRVLDGNMANPGCFVGGRRLPMRLLGLGLGRMARAMYVVGYSVVAPVVVDKTLTDFGWLSCCPGALREIYN
jgi:hypothetical protein